MQTLISAAIFWCASIIDEVYGLYGYFPSANPPHLENEIILSSLRNYVRAKISENFKKKFRIYTFSDSLIRVYDIMPHEYTL